jgi:DNA-binding response OmpR family regulator
MLKESILLASAEARPNQRLARHLKSGGYLVRTATGPRDAIKAARLYRPRLIVVEARSGEEASLELAQRLRRVVPAQEASIVLWTRESGACEPDHCRDLGVDACVSGRSGIGNVRERLEAWIRTIHDRDSSPVALHVELHGLVIDTERHEAIYRARDLKLTLTEFQLLVALARAPGRVFRRWELLKEIHALGELGERNIDVHIGALRKKLGSGRGIVRTVRGVGYKLAD